MAKKTFLAKDVTGFSVYQNKNQTIYYDKFTKTAYVLNNSSVMKFTNYQLRLPVSLLVGLGAFLITANVLFSLIGALVVFGLMEYSFRTKFLANLAINSKWVKPKSKGLIDSFARAYTTTSLKFMIFMCIMFAVMFVVNIFLSKESGAQLVVDIVFSAILVIVALVLFIAHNYKKKNG